VAKSTRILVVGAGYVGIPTAVTLSHFGYSVIVAERDLARLGELRAGRSPIREEGLDELLAEGIAAGLLTFTDNATEAAADADVVLLCVATPQGNGGEADITYIIDAATSISAALRPGSIVVNKSTVPVGTAARVQVALGRDDVFVVSNPEFLREGTAVHDSLHAERIVAGSDDPRHAEIVVQLFADTGAAVVITDTASAETIKYAANAFLATKLSFMNAMAAFCEEVGADVRDVRLGMGHDHRIGMDFLNPGPGWGGSCLPKDTAALLYMSQINNFDFPLLAGAIETNERQLARMVSKIEEAAGGLDGRTIAAWGLTFKANTDDRRSSPAIDIVQRLAARGAIVQAYDPTVAPGQVYADLDGVSVMSSPRDAARGAHCLAILTEWSEFSLVDLADIYSQMEHAAIVDCRNLLSAASVREAGFSYEGVGIR